MKIVLTRPAYSPLYQLITSKAKHKEVVPPLGLLYVAAALEQDRHQVEIIDGELEDLTPSEILRRIELSKPQVIGASATTVDFDYANLILRTAKENFTLTTILGGVHPTVLPNQILSENPHIDYLVRGEGEITARELLEELEGSKNFSRVNGLSYRERGEIINNPDRPFMPDLNKNLLPARHLVDQSKYILPVPGKGMQRTTSIQTMRGCPFDCIYCYRMFGKHVRFRDPVLVADEIEDCINRYGIECIVFMDDNFALEPERVIELCEQIVNRKLNFSWYCFSRASTIKEDLLGIMKDAGCKEISIGVESGNQEILNAAGKNTTLEQYIKAYKSLGKFGFERRGSFILGLPYENSSTLRDTVNFAKRLSLDRAFFNICTPYPATRLFQMSQRGEGLRLITNSWKEFKRWGNAVIELEDVSRDELIEWQKIAMMEFYIRPRIIFYHIKQFIKGNHTRFYYRPLFFGLKEFYIRKVKKVLKTMFLPAKDSSV